MTRDRSPGRPGGTGKPEDRSGRRRPWAAMSRIVTAPLAYPCARSCGRGASRRQRLAARAGSAGGTPAPQPGTEAGWTPALQGGRPGWLREFLRRKRVDYGKWPGLSEGSGGGRKGRSEPFRYVQLLPLPRLKATGFRTTHRDQRQRSFFPANRPVPGMKATGSRRTPRDRVRRPLLPAISFLRRTKRVRRRPLLFSVVSDPPENCKIAFGGVRRAFARSHGSSSAAEERRQRPLRFIPRPKRGLRLPLRFIHR